MYSYLLIKINQLSYQLKSYSILIIKITIFFVNGGDQNNDSIPEVKICKKLGIKLIDGLGDKIQSSSWLLKNNYRRKKSVVLERDM